MEVHNEKEIETDIKSLLLTYKGGCTIRQLNNDYANISGRYIPWKELKYKTLLEFLQSMPESVQIEYRNSTAIVRGIASEKTQHISKFVEEQKSQRTIPNRRPKLYPRYIPPRMRKLHEGSNKMNGTLTSSTINPVIVTASGYEDNINDDYTYDDTNDFFKPACKKSSVPNTSKCTSNFISESVSKYQDQYASGPKKENCSQHNSTCNAVTQTQIKFNGDTRKDENDYSKDKDSQILLNEKVKFRLQKLIENYPDGIWCADLPRKYYEEYGSQLNYNELGFTSVRHFASQLPDVFQCIQPYVRGDFKLFSPKQDLSSYEVHEKPRISSYEDNASNSSEEPVPTAVSRDISKIMIPDTVLNIEEYVDQIRVLDLVLENKERYIEVHVVEVFTPSFFWIQLRKKNQKFKDMMSNLHKFYETHREEYAIPPVVLEKDLYCACVYNGQWHRAKIMDVKPDFQTIVFFIDYGTLKIYAPRELYYLHKSFSSLPEQAIACGLVNIKPRKSVKWSQSVTQQFAVKTNDLALIAYIASIDQENNTMMISLTDTNEEEDLHINDWLVKKKLAERGNMGNKVDLNNMMLYIEENLIFKPEKCYETCTSSTNYEDTSYEEVNAPLVSPQSTLGDMLYKPAQETLLTNENPTIESTTTMFATNKVNTNPFLLDDDLIIYDEINQDISLKKFLEVWKENLEIQKYIYTTLDLLLKTEINLDETILNSIRNAFLYVNKQIPICTDPVNTAIANACRDAISFIASNYLSGINATCNNKYDLINSVGHVQNIIDLPNYVTNNSNVLSPVTSSDSAFKETNPFRQGREIYEPAKENLFDCDLINFDNNSVRSQLNRLTSWSKCNGTICQCDQIPNSINRNDGKHNSNLLNGESLHQNWTVDDVTNALSKIVISDHPKKETGECYLPLSRSLSNRDLHSIGERNKLHQTGMFIDMSKFNQPSLNQTSAILYSASSQQYPTSIANVNINNGYLLPTTSSQIMYSPSPMIDSTNKLQYSQNSIITNCTRVSGACDERKRSITNQDTAKLKHWRSGEDLLNIKVDVDNLATKPSSYLSQNELNSNEGAKYHQNYCFSNYTVLFRVIELLKGIIHVFHYKEEGWLLAQEFVEAFTKFETVTYLKKLLNVLNINVTFDEIDRSKCSIQFVSNNSTLSESTHDIINGTTRLYVIPMKTAWNILHKLEIISQEDINNIFIHEKFQTNSISYEIWLIINNYNRLK